MKKAIFVSLCFGLVLIFGLAFIGLNHLTEDHARIGCFIGGVFLGLLLAAWAS